MGIRLPRCRLPVQLLAAGLGQAVILPGAAVGLGLVGRDIAAVFQLFQDRVERALLHLEGVVRAALQLRDHLVAVQVLPLEQGEDEQRCVLQGFLFAFHEKTSSLWFSR